MAVAFSTGGSGDTRSDFMISDAAIPARGSGKGRPEGTVLQGTERYRKFQERFEYFGRRQREQCGI